MVVDAAEKQVRLHGLASPRAAFALLLAVLLPVVRPLVGLRLLAGLHLLAGDESQRIRYSMTPVSLRLSAEVIRAAGPLSVARLESY